MKRLYLVRHGESASNAGLVTDGPVLNPLTALGHSQAQRFADNWKERPSLIVTSPFIRTQETAAPFRNRFAEVQHEQWDVHEFTQLAPVKYKGTTHNDRRSDVVAYWKRMDPHYCDGPEAESFSEFTKRVDKTFRKALSRTEEAIVIFTHGTFMQAAIYLALHGHLDMTTFFGFSVGFPIQNLDSVAFYADGDRSWTIGRVTRLTR